MKKFFTSIFVALCAMSVNAQETIYSGSDVDDAKVSVLEFADGVKFTLNKAGKTYDTGKTITVDGTEYTSLKLSNGAENIVELPKAAAKVTFYSYVNKSTADASDRSNFWSQVGDNIYTAETSTLMKDFTDVDDYQANPDVAAFDLNGATKFSFKNSGYQPCVVIKITYGAGSGITNAETKKIDLDAPVYNLNGQKVSKDYKGVVVKNGKKYVQK